jgi:pyruvate-formate lyase-activating enzyme
VPEWNSEEIEQIASFLAQMKNITKIRVLPYHNYAGSKYEALGIENTLPAILPKEEDVKKVIKTFLNDN